MRFTIPALTLISLLCTNVDARWKPAVGTTWNYVLGHDIDISREKGKVVDVDLFSTSEKKISQFHKAGKKVICYFSAGTIEDNRKDKKEYEKVKGLVHNRYEEWPDERWLDIRVEGLKPLIKNRMKIAKNKKCDGIEVDNLDGYQIREVKKWKKPITRDDAIRFGKWLGQTAHSMDLSIGVKNVGGLLDQIGSYFDFAINEECIDYNECYLYNNFLRSGKPVFGVTYHGLEKNRKALCKNLNGLGISMIIKPGSKLIQDGITFDGKKHCGSSFSTAIGQGVKPGSEKKQTKKATKKSTKKTTKKTTKKASKVAYKPKPASKKPTVKKSVKPVTKKPSKKTTKPHKKIVKKVVVKKSNKKN